MISQKALTSICQFIDMQTINVWQIKVHCNTTWPYCIVKYGKEATISKGCRPRWNNGKRAYHWKKEFKSGRRRWIFSAIKISSTTSFEGELKQSVPCRILRHVKELYQYERYFVSKIQRPFPRQVSSASLTDVSAGNCQTALADKLGMITIYMGEHNRSEMVAVQGSPRAPTPQR
jgi:hypothetical protein